MCGKSPCSVFRSFSDILWRQRLLAVCRLLLLPEPFHRPVGLPGHDVIPSFLPSCRYIPLQAIGDRLLAQLEVQRWGECRGTLTGLLGAYAYEAGILAAAARLLCGDAARDLAAAYRSRTRGRPAVPLARAASPAGAGSAGAGAGAAPHSAAADGHPAAASSTEIGGPSAAGLSPGPAGSGPAPRAGSSAAGGARGGSGGKGGAPPGRMQAGASAPGADAAASGGGSRQEHSMVAKLRLLDLFDTRAAVAAAPRARTRTR